MSLSVDETYYPFRVGSITFNFHPNLVFKAFEQVSLVKFYDIDKSAFRNGSRTRILCFGSRYNVRYTTHPHYHCATERKIEPFEKGRAVYCTFTPPHPMKGDAFEVGQPHILTAKILTVGFCYRGKKWI